MRFYTKEWYELMQHQGDTLTVRQIPDRDYTDKEVKEFFEKERQAAIDLDQKIQNYNRQRFGPGEPGSSFKKRYRSLLRSMRGFPAHICAQVDRRLIALGYLPESAYQLLKEEEEKNQEAFQKIMKAAQEELSRQQIPERIRSAFRFHDNDLLSFRKRGRHYEMLIQKAGDWTEEGTTPYIKVIFTEGVLLEREAKLLPRTQIDEDGYLESNCIYLYEELYSVPDGYEVHMLFAVGKGWNDLACLTVRCGDIRFEDNITLPKAYRRKTIKRSYMIEDEQEA